MIHKILLVLVIVLGIGVLSVGIAGAQTAPSISSVEVTGAVRVEPQLLGSGTWNLISVTPDNITLSDGSNLVVARVQRGVSARNGFNEADGVFIEPRRTTPKFKENVQRLSSLPLPSIIEISGGGVKSTFHNPRIFSEANFSCFTPEQNIDRCNAPIIGYSHLSGPPAGSIRRHSDSVVRFFHQPSVILNATIANPDNTTVHGRYRLNIAPDWTNTDPATRTATTASPTVSWTLPPNEGTYIAEVSLSNTFDDPSTVRYTVTPTPASVTGITPAGLTSPTPTLHAVVSDLNPADTVTSYIQMRAVGTSNWMMLPQMLIPGTDPQATWEIDRDTFCLLYTSPSPRDS